MLHGQWTMSEPRACLRWLTAACTCLLRCTPLQAKERLAASLCLQKMADKAFDELRTRSYNGAKGSTVGDWMVGGACRAEPRCDLVAVSLYH